MMINFKKYLTQLNEGLIKTNDINTTIDMVDDEMSSMGYDFNIFRDNNVILLTLNNFNHITLIADMFNHINSMLVNRFGWFPSKMKLLGVMGNENLFNYDEVYLANNKDRIQKIEIRYESKFDIESNLPIKLYHISTQTYIDRILKNGLFPKSKSKLSNHPDRIYVCSDIKSCKNLIPRMNMYNISTNQIDMMKGNKPNRNNDWVIYEIDTSGIDIRLYKDPNYEHGYYIIDNIPPTKIDIIERQ